LARDAQASGDPVAAENYFQHAEHYFRLIAAAQEQFRQANPYYQQQQTPGPVQGAADVQEDFEDGDGEPIGQPGLAPQGPGGEQPQFGTRDPQPYLPRDAQFFQPRDQQGGNYGGGRQHQQPRNDGDVDRLPSFITGGQPQSGQQGQGGQGGHPNYGANGYDNGQNNERGERFHRRRRRHRGPRHDVPGQGMNDGGDEGPRQGE